MLGEGNGDYNKAQKFISILMVETAREYKWNINDNNSPEGDQTILAIAKPDSKSSAMIGRAKIRVHCFMPVKMHKVCLTLFMCPIRLQEVTIFCLSIIA